MSEAPVGRGRTADVFALDADRVVKLLRPGFDPELLAVEAARTGSAHAAGVAAPAVHGPLTVDGRPGYVFERVEGGLMLEALRRRPWRVRSLGVLLASVHGGVHARRTDSLPDVKERLAGHIRRAPGLPDAVRDAARRSLATLEDGDTVLHGDFHPGNVMLSPRGPVVIDWIDASRGSPAADVARALWLMSPGVIPPGLPGRRRLAVLAGLLRRRYFDAYLSATGLDPDRIRRWRLPVLAARLAEGIEHESARLLAEIARLAEPD